MKGGSRPVVSDSTGHAVSTFTHFQAPDPGQPPTWFYVDVHCEQSKIVCICRSEDSHDDCFHNETAPNKTFPEFPSLRNESDSEFPCGAVVNESDEEQ